MGYRKIWSVNQHCAGVNNKGHFTRLKKTARLQDNKNTNKLYERFISGFELEND